MSLRKSVVLCGFMGCGKSTVGPELAARLVYSFVDLDQEIEALAGMTIPEIFRQRGEDAFRDMEARVLASLCQEGAKVIAAGGGALLRPDSAAAARAYGRVVFINCAFDLCYQRIKDSDRPLVRSKSRQELEELYEQRLPLYRQVCDFEVFNQHSAKDAAKAIVSSLL